MMKEGGTAAFEGRRLRRPGVVAVAFLADWCPFCRAFRPHFSRLGRNEGWSALVADVSSEENPLWDEFHLEVLPTVVVFREGRAILRVDGVPGVGLGRSDLRAIEVTARAALAQPPTREAETGRGQNR